jgi:ABC-type polysaccharide/polyol phosphate transport system ATPase subunit
LPEESAILVNDVVKQYKVRHEKGRTLKEAFLRQGIYSETINALNHVSFDVPWGSTLGLVGRNGSGKSTMLKLIAGTSKPNSGEVTVRGRVSALLELGAGFHPDFTGRENIYLDGAIMGLSRRDVDERIEDIVQFAEMEEFIDAPAKTYSSGMYMRLAFSVAVSVEPDILIIDEVLAVGDESFQKKCLKRINEFKEQGKTLIFVSHSLAAVRSLCDEAIWIDRGNLKAKGKVDDVLDEYLVAVYERDAKRRSGESKTAGSKDKNRWGTRRAEITDVKLLDESGNESYLFKSGDNMKVQISYRSKETVDTPRMGLMIRTAEGKVCFGTNTQSLGDAPDHLPESGTAEVVFEDLPLLIGSYAITVLLMSDNGAETYDYHDSKYHFSIVHGIKGIYGINNIPHQWHNWPGAE